MKKIVRIAFVLTLLVSTIFTYQQIYAADGDSSSSAKVSETNNSNDAKNAQPGFVEIVVGDSIFSVNFLIWLMIFATSFATLWFIIDAIITIKREKLLPEHVAEGVRNAMNEGDLEAAVEVCEANPSPLSRVLLSGFSNIEEDYEIIQESVIMSADLENEKLMQRVNYLNLCGQIAPMLGLLGTVTGMVGAFGALGGTSGAAQASLLAIKISTALWTTAIGLLVSVPAILAYTFIRDKATMLFMESESIVLDLIKVLRNTEIEEEEEEEEEEDA